MGCLSTLDLPFLFAPGSRQGMYCDDDVNLARRENFLVQRMSAFVDFLLREMGFVIKDQWLIFASRVAAPTANAFMLRVRHPHLTSSNWSGSSSNTTTLTLPTPSLGRWYIVRCVQHGSAPYRVCSRTLTSLKEPRATNVRGTESAFVITLSATRSGHQSTHLGRGATGCYRMLYNRHDPRASQREPWPHITRR